MPPSGRYGVPRWKRLAVGVSRRQILQNRRRTGSIRLGFSTRHVRAFPIVFLPVFLGIFSLFSPVPSRTPCRGSQRGTCRNAGKTTPPLGRIYRSRANRKIRRENVSIRDVNAYVRRSYGNGRAEYLVFRKFFTLAFGLCVTKSVTCEAEFFSFFDRSKAYTAPR